MRLGRFVDLDLPDDVIGITALRKIKAEGAKRHQLGVVLQDQPRQPGQAIWYVVQHAGTPVGHWTNGGWSLCKETLIGYVQVAVIREG